MKLRVLASALILTATMSGCSPESDSSAGNQSATSNGASDTSAAPWPDGRTDPCEFLASLDNFAERFPTPPGVTVRIPDEADPNTANLCQLTPSDPTATGLFETHNNLEGDFDEFLEAFPGTFTEESYKTCRIAWSSSESAPHMKVGDVAAFFECPDNKFNGVLLSYSGTGKEPLGNDTKSRLNSLTHDIIDHLPGGGFRE